MLSKEAGQHRCAQGWRTIRPYRLLPTQPPGIFAAVGAANSGGCTLPTLDLRYPDGLGSIGLTRDDVVRLLGYTLVIFSGDQDTDGTADNFPKHERRWRRGQTGLRAQFYIDRGHNSAPSGLL